MKILKFIITTLQVIVGFIVKGIIFIYDIVNPPISKSMLIIKNAINEGSNATSILDEDGNQYQFATLSQK